MTIDKLSKDQEAQLPVYRDKWIKIGLGTTSKPMDMDRVKAAVAKAYKAADQKVPTRIIEAGSPKGLVDKIMEVAKCTKQEAQNSILHGSHEAGWLSFYDYMHEVLSIEKAGELQGLNEMAKCCGWWAPFDTAVFVSPLPTVINVDEEGLLDCETGPAIAYPDGWAIWALKGQAVTEQIVMAPETLTIEQIQSESNVEIRRVMRERFGEGKYLIESGAKVVDSDFEGARKGAAPRCLIEDDQNQRFLVGTDGSTGRVYYMQVDPRIGTCKEAHDSICFFDESLIVNKS